MGFNDRFTFLLSQHFLLPFFLDGFVRISSRLRLSTPSCFYLFLFSYVLIGNTCSLYPILFGNYLRKSILSYHINILVSFTPVY